MSHTSPPAPTLLLLSGAGLPAWIWDETRAALGSHRPGVVGPRPRGSASLEDHARAVLDLAAEGDLALVAHSAGAVVAHEVARLAPGRVRSVLLVSGVVPPSEGSFVSAMPAPQRYVLPLVLRLAGTRPPASAVRKGLAAGLDPEVQDRLVAEMEPESRAYFTDPVGAGGLPRRVGYVTTTRDRELTPALQARFADRSGAAWRRDLASGHLPMLEAPEALASLVDEFSVGHLD
ncbi:alpha/beta hydrolase [Aeromicrobium alkaliterrae]|uniref:AB hydrolase-1 domain-containing protein n=1 Tax=Aeromicrobium alkaliterrae TaxID=302168 RepID=A0ABP4WA81_9ACTN